jgi:hypothetical protein
MRHARLAMTEKNGALAPFLFGPCADAGQERLSSTITSMSGVRMSSMA